MTILFLALWLQMSAPWTAVGPIPDSEWGQYQ
jgi:hypothetical protein